MKYRRSILLFVILLLLLLTPLAAALPWGTRWQSCHDDCDPSTGEGTCVLVRKLPPWAVWVVNYADNDSSGSFHPAYDTIIQSNMTFTPRRVSCSDVTRP